MRAAKLVKHMTDNADRMSEGLIQKIRGSDRCRELLLKMSEEEHKRYGLEVYRDLTEWLAGEDDSIIQNRFVDLGMQRAQRGVPFAHLFWAVCIAREHLWEYIQQECLLEEPVEFWGGVTLLRSLNQFFDRALYFTLLGYLKAAKNEATGLPAAFVAD